MTETQADAILDICSIPGGCSATGILLRLEDAGLRYNLDLATLRAGLATAERQGLIRWYRHADGCGPRMFQSTGSRG